MAVDLPIRLAQPAEDTAAAMPMGKSSPGRRDRARLRSGTLRLAIGQLALGAVVLAGIEIALTDAGPPIPWQLALSLPACALVFVSAGVVAWLRRPSNYIGALLCAGGYACLAAGLGATPQSALIAVGEITATVALALLVHLLHAFPSGRLRGTASVWTVALGYVVCLVLQVPLYLFSAGPLEVANRPDLAHAGKVVQIVAGSLVMIATAVILATRLTAMSTPQRRLLRPLYAYGIATVLWVPISANLLSFDVVTRFTVQTIAVAGVPVVFVLAMLRGGFARTGELQELGAWLGMEDGAHLGLQDALADALGDPSLVFAFWIEDTWSYAGYDGRTLHLPAVGEDRAAVEVQVRGHRVGAIVYDATLIGDAGLVRAAGRIVALALEREQLTAALRASGERLRASRARIAQTADEERRRIARDLHDGLQTTLVVLAMKAHAVRAGAGDSTRTQAAELHAGLHDAILELRELVHGVMPPALTEGGLYGAVQELAERMPIPTHLELDEDAGRLSPPLETAGYFLVSEALTNAVKHSRAHELALRIARDDGRLRIEVADDGIGGAQQRAGGGLRGIADRIEALDGRLRLESPVDGGTRLIAELPCAS